MEDSVKLIRLMGSFLVVFVLVASQPMALLAQTQGPMTSSDVQRLEDALERYVERRKLGRVFHAPLDVVFSPTLVLQPDIFFIYRNRLNIVKDYVYGPPDLVIEVVSPDRPRRDYKDKKEKYEAHRVHEYWIVDPERKQIEVWSLKQDFYQLAGLYTGKQFAASVLLTGFKVRLDRLFAQPW